MTLELTPEKAISYLRGDAESLLKHLDNLWVKGKEEKWPKNVMDYLMWFEHEVCRAPQTIEWKLRPLENLLNKEK